MLYITYTLNKVKILPWPVWGWGQHWSNS